MARNDDDPNEYPDQDPTQYANYTGDTGGTGGEAYSEYQQPEYGQTGYGYPADYGTGPRRSRRHRGTASPPRSSVSERRSSSCSPW